LTRRTVGTAQSLTGTAAGLAMLSYLRDVAALLSNDGKPVFRKSGKGGPA
jgi:DNA-binding IclR family transcriptional regulator